MPRAVAYVGLLALSLLGPLSLLRAQEELPAPAGAKAPAAPPRRLAAEPDRADIRAQRRERLRNLGGQVLGAITTPDGGAPGAAAAIDIPKLNGALGPLVTALLGGGQDIESLKIGFDPAGTNFAEDRLRLGLDAALRRTAWSDAPSKIGANLGAQVVQNDAGGLVAVLDGRLRMQTSAVALANYALVQYKQRSKENTADAPPTPAGVTPPTATADEIFGQLLDERLARVESIESLDDVADLVTAISGLRLMAIDQRIEQLRDQSRTATDADVRQDLATELAQTRAQRDKLFDLRPRIKRGSNGAVQMIAVDMVGSEIFPGADMRQLECQITENEVLVQASGALSRWVEFYPVVKPLVMGVLQRIQSGDPRALDAIRPFVDGSIGRGRALILGEPQ